MPYQKKKITNIAITFYVLVASATKNAAPSNFNVL